MPCREVKGLNPGRAGYDTQGPNITKKECTAVVLTSTCTFKNV